MSMVPLEHAWQSLPGQLDRSEEVDLDFVRDLGGSARDERSDHALAGVVDEDVDRATRCVRRSIDESVDFAGSRQVCRECHSLDLGRQVLQRGDRTGDQYETSAAAANDRAIDAPIPYDAARQQNPRSTQCPPHPPRPRTVQRYSTR